MKITQDKLDMWKSVRVAALLAKPISLLVLILWPNFAGLSAAMAIVAAAALLGEAGVTVLFAPARIAAKNQEKRRGGAGDVRRLSPRS